MSIFGAAARAAIVRLVCPSCGEIQARARRRKDATYACRKCGTPFTEAESTAAQEPRARARKKP